MLGDERLRHTKTGEEFARHLHRHHLRDSWHQCISEQTGRGAATSTSGFGRPARSEKLSVMSPLSREKSFWTSWTTARAGLVFVLPYRPKPVTSTLKPAMTILRRAAASTRRLRPGGSDRRLRPAAPNPAASTRWLPPGGSDDLAAAASTRRLRPAAPTRESRTKTEAFCGVSRLSAAAERDRVRSAARPLNLAAWSSAAAAGGVLSFVPELSRSLIARVAANARTRASLRERLRTRAHRSAKPPRARRDSSNVDTRRRRRAAARPHACVAAAATRRERCERVNAANA